jgi:hypothetical protein
MTSRLRSGPSRCTTLCPGSGPGPCRQPMLDRRERQGVLGDGEASNTARPGPRQFCKRLHVQRLGRVRSTATTLPSPAAAPGGRPPSRLRSCGSAWTAWISGVPRPGPGLRAADMLRAGPHIRQGPGTGAAQAAVCARSTRRGGYMSGPGRLGEASIGYRQGNRQGPSPRTTSRRSWGRCAVEADHVAPWRPRGPRSTPGTCARKWSGRAG